MPADVTSIRREHIEGFLVDVIERRSPATAEARYRGLRSFFLWLEAEGEIGATPMARMRPPKVVEQPVPVPTEAALRKLLTTWVVAAAGAARVIQLRRTHRRHPGSR